jgi:hypothetical protein
VSPLVIVAVALSVGWVVFGVLLWRHARQQSELAKKIEELER